jgi:hypothetical protein
VTGERATAAREVDALRRLATLVAQGVPPAEIFAAVSDEVEALFGSGAVVMKFDHDLPGVVFAGVSTGPTPSRSWATSPITSESPPG